MVGMESKRLEDLLKLLNGIVLIVLINLLVSSYYFRIDLTEEKRFSITDPTKDLLGGLDDNVYVEVYLDGDLPASFMRLQEAVRETLEEFRIYSDNKVQYIFIDPDQAASEQSREEFIISIAQKGIQPTDVFLTENGAKVQKRILPGVIINYGSREIGVLLLKGNKGAPPEVQLNQSAEGVEYEIANAIRTLTKERAEAIGFSTGHNELRGSQQFAFRDVLSEKYTLRDVDLTNPAALSGINLLIIHKPSESFVETEKFNLDQYIINGGKALFLLDVVEAELDSFAIAMPTELGLDDLLFKYGVRINKDVVGDYFSLSNPVVVGNMGENPQVQMLPWPFFPMINTFGDHPIVRNLDALNSYYASSIDTVKADGITKTPLFTTSPYSRTFSTPLKIDLNELKKPIKPEDFTQANIPLGYLLEGEFTSAYKNRPLPEGAAADSFSESGSSAIVVISDGDIAKNDIDPKTGQPFPLGYDMYSRQTYANEQFLLNTINYLVDDQGLIEARSKQIVLRPLDKVKVENERNKWQAINMLLPILLLLLYGVVNKFIRKRKYASF